MTSIRTYLTESKQSTRSQRQLQQNKGFRKRNRSCWTRCMKPSSAGAWTCRQTSSSSCARYRSRGARVRSSLAKIYSRRPIAFFSSSPTSGSSRASRPNSWTARPTRPAREVKRAGHLRCKHRAIPR